MTVRLELPFKPFSINQMTYRDVRFKSAAYKEWATKMIAHIQDCDQYKQLLDMATDHKASGGTFEISIHAEYPKHEFLNKQGQISSKTVDISNAEKPLIDIIFGGLMEVNDKYITSMTSSKGLGAWYKITVEISYYESVSS